MAMGLGVGAAAASGGSGGVGSDGGAGGGGGTERATTGDGVFPIRGKHTYGDGLGAGRGHQGQDLLAKCGKPVVAAEPGRVQRNKYQSSAGNYVVIDGKGNARGHGLHAPPEPLSAGHRRQGRGRRRDREGRRHREHHRLSPALRDLVEPRLVRGRLAARPAPEPAALGPEELARPAGRDTPPMAEAPSAGVPQRSRRPGWEGRAADARRIAERYEVSYIATLRTVGLPQPPSGSSSSTAMSVGPPG